VFFCKTVSTIPIINLFVRFCSADLINPIACSLIAVDISVQTSYFLSRSICSLAAESGVRCHGNADADLQHITRKDGDNVCLCVKDLTVIVTDDCEAYIVSK